VLRIPHGNFVNILSYLDAAKARKMVNSAFLSGNDQLILWNLKAGGTGGIAGCANVYPHTFCSFTIAMAGDWDKAREYQDSIASFRACFKLAIPIHCKDCCGYAGT